MSFKGLAPTRLVEFNGYELDRIFTAGFEGRGFVLTGRFAEYRGQARCTVLVHGRLIEDIVLKGDLHSHRFPFFWYYDLKAGNDTLVVRKEGGDGRLRFDELLVYKGDAGNGAVVNQVDPFRWTA